MRNIHDFVQDVIGQLEGFVPEGGLVHFDMPVFDFDDIFETGEEISGHFLGIVPTDGRDRHKEIRLSFDVSMGASSRETQ